MPPLIGKKCDCGKLATVKLTKNYRGGGSSVKDYCQTCASQLGPPALLSHSLQSAKLRKYDMKATNTPLLKLAKKNCAACEGTGKSSKGAECYPCHGTGVAGASPPTILPKSAWIGNEQEPEPSLFD